MATDVSGMPSRDVMCGTMYLYDRFLKGLGMPRRA
jgi:hypothetical protein